MEPLLAQQRVLAGLERPHAMIAQSVGTAPHQDVGYDNDSFIFVSRPLIGLGSKRRGERLRTPAGGVEVTSSLVSSIGGRQAQPQARTAQGRGLRLYAAPVGVG